MTLRRTKQGGSVASYIIIGILLTVALVGSIYLLNKRGQQVKRDQQIAADNKQKSDTGSDQNKKTKEAAAKPTAVTSNPTSDSNNTSNPVSLSSTGVAVLPQTGPSDDLLGYIGLYAISMATCGYYISARRLKNSL
ncbi:hypothetical protein HGB25_01130 [Candidatus Saccharibacteria bacterium]|nr:hypothetical protein [Candidatus Saccharibacteria bacterium]